MLGRRLLCPDEDPKCCHHRSVLFLDSRAAIIMGTHKEGGATSFWSYTLNLPLSSNALISWKFCYLLHKVLRDGHRNARRFKISVFSP